MKRQYYFIVLLCVVFMMGCAVNEQNANKETETIESSFTEEIFIEQERYKLFDSFREFSELYRMLEQDDEDLLEQYLEENLYREVYVYSKEQARDFLEFADNIEMIYLEESENCRCTWLQYFPDEGLFSFLYTVDRPKVSIAVRLENSRLLNMTREEWESKESSKAVQIGETKVKLYPFYRDRYNLVGDGWTDNAYFKIFVWREDEMLGTYPDEKLLEKINISTIREIRELYENDCE